MVIRNMCVFLQRSIYHRTAVSSSEAMVGVTMQLHTGAEHFGNVIFRYSKLKSKYHTDA
jgi:hypothetical protein